MFKTIKKWFSPTKEAKTLLPKDIATSKKEPWIEVVKIDLEDGDFGSGSFELDWNDYFVTRLMKSGYQGRNDIEIVDAWFRAVCQNVVLESFEQELADPEKRAAFERKNPDYRRGDF